MAKVKNPPDEKSENIIFVKKENTEDGYTHYAKIRKNDLRRRKPKK